MAGAYCRNQLVDSQFEAHDDACNYSTSPGEEPWITPPIACGAGSSPAAPARWQPRVLASLSQGRIRAGHDRRPADRQRQAQPGRLSRKAAADRADLAAAAARNAVRGLQRGPDHAERCLLRPLSQRRHPDLDRRRQARHQDRRQRGGQALPADAGRAAHPVQADRVRGRQPVLGQQPRPLLAARDRRAAGQRRDGQRALGRRAAEGRAGARRAEEHRAAGHLQRARHRASSAAAISSSRST